MDCFFPIKKRQDNFLGSNQVFDKSKRRIKWRRCYFFGQVWWFKQGIAETLIDETCSLSDLNRISVLSAWTQVGYNVISAFTLDSGERVLVNRWDTGTDSHYQLNILTKSWYISTGDGCLRAWAMPAPGRRVRWVGVILFTFYTNISGDWWARNIRSTPYNRANIQPDSEK